MHSVKLSPHRFSMYFLAFNTMSDVRCGPCAEKFEHPCSNQLQCDIFGRRPYLWQRPHWSTMDIVNEGWVTECQGLRMEFAGTQPFMLVPESQWPPFLGLKCKLEIPLWWGKLNLLTISMVTWIIMNQTWFRVHSCTRLSTWPLSASVPWSLI